MELEKPTFETVLSKTDYIARCGAHHPTIGRKRRMPRDQGQPDLYGLANDSMTVTAAISLAGSRMTRKTGFGACHGGWT